MDVSRQVAEYKIETGKKVFDKQREQEKIAGVKALTHNCLLYTSRLMRTIWRSSTVWKN